MRSYRCGGWSSRSGPCGALDCDRCHPGGRVRLAAEAETAEVQAELDEIHAELDWTTDPTRRAALEDEAYDLEARLEELAAYL